MPGVAPEGPSPSYEPPRLTRFGNIASLTAGGSLAQQNEFRFEFTIFGMVIVFDTCDDPNRMAPGNMC